MQKAVILLLIFLISAVPISGAVRLNEVLIDPQQSIELINTASVEADISKWYLDDSGGATYFSIPEHTLIPGNACIVFTSDFNLNKSSSDTVRLFDSTATPTESGSNLIDSFTYKASAGSGLSYARLPDGDGTWSTGSASIGKRNDNNASCLVEPTSTPTIILTQAPTQPDNILLSEIMIRPEGDEHEWVELYNNNDHSVSLVDWYIDDISNAGASPKKFSADLAAYQYKVIELSSDIFNNTEDSVRLLDGAQNEKNSTEYSDIRAYGSYGRQNAVGSFCNMNPTKESVNTDCLPDASPTLLTPTKVATPSSTPSPTVRQVSPTIRSSKVSKTLRGSILGTASSAPPAFLEFNSWPDIVKALTFFGFVASLLSAGSILLKLK